MNFDSLDELRNHPQSLEAERAVLGGVMLDAKALHRVADILEAADFYQGQHQAIWTAIQELADRRQPYDEVTVADRLEARGSEVPSAYVIGIARDTFTSANVVAYARIVADKAMLRRVIDFGSGLVNSGFNPDGRDTADILAEAQQGLIGMQPKQRGGLEPAAASLGDWYIDLQNRYERGDKLTGMPTPWSDLNKRTHGLQNGELILLAARPSMGKSVAGMNLALFAALRGVNTAVFSLEMGKRQIHRRNIASLANIPHDWLLSPNDEGEDYWPAMNAALSRIKGAPLHIDDTADLTIGQVMARARMLHLQHPLGLIVVDHVHDFKIKASEARFEYGRIAQGLKTLAKEFDCPVVALAQLNRNVNGRGDKVPNLADLRESGELEQKGDLILFLHREDYYDKACPNPGVVEMIIAKGRDIEAGVTVYLKNDYAHMALRDQDDGFRYVEAKAKDRKGWGE